MNHFSQNSWKWHTLKNMPLNYVIQPENVNIRAHEPPSESKHLRGAVKCASTGEK